MDINIFPLEDASTLHHATRQRNHNLLFTFLVLGILHLPKLVGTSNMRASSDLPNVEHMQG
jgi:hypothetical protein